MSPENNSSSEEEFQPRPRDLVIGGIPWIARMSDKARAKANGSIGEYIYPCPVDRRVLAELGISAEEFLAMSVQVETDAALVEQVRERRQNPPEAVDA
ncbi:MAG TPA: hypothetical protein DGO43_04425 [Chloroflexi bacterium]|nr:hypothetical protein [Chloroflexota bacterium]|tara:strand:+ start:4238 stop:4531 length:294 start_codon:yes stop_codon:yes gene_type:complete